MIIWNFLNSFPTFWHFENLLANRIKTTKDIRIVKTYLTRFFHECEKAFVAFLPFLCQAKILVKSDLELVSYSGRRAQIKYWQLFKAFGNFAEVGEK